MVPSSLAPPPLARALGVSVIGTAAFGAFVAAGHGARAMLGGAWLAPALFLGGAALAVPPLYLANALSGGTTRPSQLVDAAARSLTSVAIALLGLALPALFFSVTLRGRPATALLLGVVATVGALGVFAVVRGALERERGARANLATLVWAVFALALGARLISALGPIAASLLAGGPR